MERFLSFCQTTIFDARFCLLPENYLGFIILNVECEEESQYTNTMPSRSAAAAFTS